MIPMTESRPTSEWSYPVVGVVIVTALYAVLYRLVPYHIQAYLLWPFGALALYTGSRLRICHALAILFAVQLATDLTFYFVNQWGIPKTTYLAWTLFVLLGVSVRPLLRQHWLTAAAGIGGASVIGYAMFFLITNTAAWLGNARPEYEPHTFETLMEAYAQGLAFIRTRPGQVIGNPVCVGLVFGAHAALARAYKPAERFGTEQLR